MKQAECFMINLVLDTNIYRGDIGRNTAAFQTLESLIKQKYVNLHVPKIVEREFISQLYLHYLKCYEDIIKNLSKLTEIKVLDTKTVKLLESDYFDKKKILERSGSHFLDWLAHVNAKRYGLSLDIYQTTFDDYFEGKPPFSGVKSRKDIPDSLVFQNIKQICEDENDIHFISEDKGFLKACKQSFPGLKIYSSLDEFIKSDVCAPFLSKSGESIILEYCRVNESMLTGKFFPIVSSLLLGEKIESYKIPDDNHEANIISVNELNSMAYQFSEAVYYGDGVLVVPCTFSANVAAYYYLFKSDYDKPGYVAREQVLSISEHDEGYYEVSQNYEVFITATLRFEFEIIDGEDGSIVNLKNCGVESLLDIEVI